MSEQVMYFCGWLGIFAPMALGAIGSMVGCAIAGKTACGAMLEVDGGYGRFVGLSAMPSSQTIYGIVVMFTLQNAATSGDKIVLTPQNAYGIFAIGVLVGVALLASAFYQGQTLAASINASKSKPSVFGISVAPAGIVEGFAVFVFVFGLVLAGSIPADSAEAGESGDRAHIEIENDLAVPPAIQPEHERA